MFTAPIGPEQSGSYLRDPADAPHLITYSQGMFPNQATFGYKRFPTILEGLTRPDISAQPVPSSIVIAGERLSTYGQFYDLTDSDLESLNDSSYERVVSSIDTTITRMRELLQHTPQGNVLLYSAGVKPSNYLPIHPDHESELDEQLRSFIRGTFANAQDAFRAMVMRFGLDSWQLQSTDGVSAATGLTTTTVRKCERAILHGLYTDPRGVALREKFGSLPVNSLGALMGKRYAHEIPIINHSLHASADFSEDDLRFLSDLEIDALVTPRRRTDPTVVVASAELSKTNRSPEYRSQLAEKLGSFINKFGA